MKSFFSQKKTPFFILLCLIGCKKNPTLNFEHPILIEEKINKETPERSPSDENPITEAQTKTNHAYMIFADDLSDNLNSKESYYFLKAQKEMILDQKKDTLAIEIPNELKTDFPSLSFSLTKKGERPDFSLIEFRNIQEYTEDEKDFLFIDLKSDPAFLEKTTYEICFYQKDAQSMHSLLEEKITQEEKKAVSIKELSGFIQMKFIAPTE
jgi:hypothetical protein